MRPSLKPEYIQKLKDMQAFVKKRLEEKGLFVEETNDDMGLTISLTQFGLSTMYATIGQEELEYFIDNDLEL